MHALDPALPHATSDGIMSAHLTPEMLRRERLGFTAPTAAGVVSALSEPR